MSDTVSTENLPTEDGTADGGGQRRLLMIGGGAAVPARPGPGAYFLFLSGGEEEDLALVRPRRGSPRRRTPDKDDKGDNGKDERRARARSTDDFAVGRDPFAPLAVEEVVEAEP